ncbi:hypothetical protein ACIPSA_46270 [Streptomyces sp. NPDC086549]|uniref:hypothetical protein n=1 Tax=Streptomyces sp. NPDC086549 TaxID=3365752 RepID=UPI0037F9F344
MTQRQGQARSDHGIQVLPETNALRARAACTWAADLHLGAVEPQLHAFGVGVGANRSSSVR